MNHSNWVYLQAEPRLFTVGFFDPAGNWQPDSDHPSRDHAASRCNFLNGGWKVDVAMKVCQTATMREALRLVQAELACALQEEGGLHVPGGNDLLIYVSAVLKAHSASAE